jgi:hypothetical protein
MATRPGTYVTTQLAPFALVLEWTGLLQGDDGDWRLLGHYNDKSLHVYGTFGVGATITFEGSNEDSPTAGNSVGLTDPTQAAISFTAKGLKQVLENPLYVRPKVTGGDGTTALTVRLVCRH